MIGAEYLEIARRQSRTNRLLTALMCRTAIGGALSFGLATGFAAREAKADPTGGVVVGGAATINQAGTHTQINQGSQTAIINWQTFGIQQGESVSFAQPNANALAINRVQTAVPSNIAGELTANGNVWIQNSAGVFIQRSAQINVGGILATTAQIDTDALDLSKGVQAASASGAAAGSVVSNEGTVNVGDGSIVLVAPVVENSGSLTANGSDVALGAGSGFTVDFSGDGLTRFEVAAGSGISLSNTGNISAQGGAAYISAASADTVQDAVVSIGGKVEATRIEDKGGVIVISGGDTGVTEVTGELNATQIEGDGGRVVVTGDKVDIAASAVIDASGAESGGKVEIGGGFQGGAIDVPVVRQAAAPDSAPVPTARRVRIAEGAVVKANAGAEGDGGTIIVWSDQITGFAGSIEARGGFVSGDGGFAEVSGKSQLFFTGAVDLSATNGTIGRLLLDPTDIIIADGGVATPADILFDDDGLDGDGGVGAGDGTSTIDADFLNNAVAAITLQAQNDITVNEFVNTVQDVTLEAGNDIVINQSLLTTGTLTLTADADFSGGGGAASDGVGTVTFGGGVISGSTATITTGESVQLGGITASNLSVTSGGAITDTGGQNITSNNAATFTAAAGQDVVIDNLTHSFSAVSASGQNLTLNSAGSFSLDSVTATGTLTAQAVSGNISDLTGTISVAGTSSITAGASISFDNGSHDFGGAVAASGGAITLTDVDDITLGAITATGNVTIQGTEIDTTATVDAGANTVTFVNAGGDATDIGGTENASATSFLISNADIANVTAATLSVQSAGGNITISDADASAANFATLAVGASNSGSVTIGNGDATLQAFTVADAVSYSHQSDGATLVANGNVDITTSGTASLGDMDIVGTLSVTAGDVNVTDIADGVVVSTATLGTGDGTINIASSSGAAMTVGGAGLGAGFVLDNVDIQAMSFNQLNISSGNQDVTIEAVSQPLNLLNGDNTKSISIDAGSGLIDVVGVVTFDAITPITGDIALLADDINVNTVTGSITNSAGGILLTDTSGSGMVLGDAADDGNNDNFDLTAAEIARLNGQSLTVTSNDALVTLAGGTFGDPTTIVAGTGAVSISGATTFSGALTIASAAGVTQSDALAVAGVADITSTAAVTLDNVANDFDNDDTGDAVSVNAGANAVSLTDTDNLLLGAITANALTGTSVNGAITVGQAIGVTGGNVSLTAESGLDINANIITTTSGDIALDSDSGGDGGDIDIAGGTSIVAAGDLTLDTGAGGGAMIDTGAGAVTLTSGGTLQLPVTNFDGSDLVVTAGGAITQNGAVSITGALSLSASDGATDFFDIVLTDTGNSITGEVTATGEDIALANTVGITLGNISANNDGTADTTIDNGNDGDLSVTAGGAIAQATGDSIVAPGTADFITEGQTITLANTGNDFGTVAADTDQADDGGEVAVQVTDTNSVILGATEASDLTVIAGGAITQSGAVVATGVTSLTASDGATNFFDILLGNTGNVLTGEVTASGEDITLVNSIALTLGNITANNDGTADTAIDNGNDGDLSVTAGGAIAQATGDSIVAPGTADFITEGQTITLANTANDFGTIAADTDQADDGGEVAVQLTDTNAVILGATEASDLTVIAGGSITQSGAIFATTATLTASDGAANFFDILLANGNNSITGEITVVNAEDVTLTNNADTTLGNFVLNGGDGTEDSTITGTTGNLVVSLTAGHSITQATGDALTVPGTASFSTENGTITVANAANTFGAVALDTDSADDGGELAASVQESDSVLISSADVGDLTVVSGGTITQAFGITATGTTTLTAATGADITLANAANDFGGQVIVNGTAGNVSLNDSNTLSVGAITVDDIVDDDADLATRTDFDVVTLSAGNAIVLGGNINALLVSIQENAGGGIDFGDANALALNVAGGVAANLTTSGAALELLTSGNIVTDNVDFSSFTGDVLLNGAVVSFDGDASNFAGPVQITSTAGVSQTAAVTISGALSISAAGQTVALANSGNDFASVAVNSQTAVIADQNALQLAAITTTGDLTVTANGTITDTAGSQISVGGTTSLLASDGGTEFHDIVLDNSDTVTGDIHSLNTLVATAEDILVNNVDALDLGAITTNGATDTTEDTTIAGNTGSLTVRAGGSITDSAASSIAGDLNVTAQDFTNTATFADIVLNNNHDIGGTVSASGEDILLREVGTGAQTLGTIVARDTGADATFAPTNNGSVVLNMNGGIDDGSSGSITAPGQLSMVTGGTSDITLDNEGLHNVARLEITAAQNATFNNEAGLVIDGIGSTSALTSVTIAAEGSVTQAGGIETGALSVTAQADGAADNFDIALTDTGNTITGAITATGEDISITNAGATSLAAITTSDDSAGTTDSTIDNGNDGDFTLVSAGSITDTASQAITVVGTTSLLAESGGDFFDIALDEAGVHNFSDANPFNASGEDITVNDLNGIQLGAVATHDDSAAVVDATIGNGNDGDLTVIAAGSITDTSGSAIVVAGTTSLLAESGGAFFDILLDNANTHDFSETDDFIANAGDLTVDDVDGIQLGAVVLAANTDTLITSNAGDLILRAGGTATQSAAITVPGTTTIENAANAINLSQANTLTGAVNAAGSDITLAVDDTIVLADIDATGNLTVTAGGSITDDGAGNAEDADIDVAGVTSLSAAGQIVLDDLGNDFDDDATGDAVNITGGNTITLVDRTAIVLGDVTATTVNPFSVDAGGTITDTGTIVINGVATLRTESAGTASITIDGASNTFGARVNLDTDINNDGGEADVTFLDNDLLLTLGDVDANNVVVTHSGTTGIFGSGGVQDIEGTASYQTNGGQIDLSNTANDFTGAVSLNADLDGTGGDAGAVTVTDSNALPLGTVNAGTLNATALGGAITDNGVSIVSGATTLTAQNAGATDQFDILLDGTVTISGALIATGEDISITNAGATTLSAITTTDNSAGVVDTTIDNGNDGDFTLISAGSITDTTGQAIIVTGTTSLLAENGGDFFDIALDNADLHDFSAVNPFNASGEDITVDDLNGIQLGALTTHDDSAAVVDTTIANGNDGDLTVNANGEVTDTSGSAVTAPGLASFNVVGGAVTLDNAGIHDLGSLTGSATAFTVDELLGLTVVSLTSTTGNIDIDTTGSMLATGAINSAGTLNVNAAALASFSGGSATALTVTSSDIAFLTSTFAVGGGTGVTSLTNNGADQTTIGGAADADDATYELAAADIANLSTGTLTGETDGGALTFNGAALGGVVTTFDVADAGVTTEGAVDFQNASAFDTLTITGASGITEASGASVTVTNATSLVASGDISLDQVGNDFQGVANASGVSVTLTDANDIVLGDIDATGTLTVRAVAGGITDDGDGAAAGDDVNVDGTASLSASGDIVLDDLHLSFDNDDNGVGEVDIAAANATIKHGDALILGSVSVTGNLKVSAEGTITDTASEAIIVGGTTSLQAGDGATTFFDIVLDNADLHDFADSGAGDADLTGNNITIDDLDGIQLGTIDARGNLTVTAGNGGANADIVQSAGSAIGVAGATSLTAVGTGSDILLANTGNDFDNDDTGAGQIDASATDIALTDAGNILLGDIDAAGNLTVISGSTITDDGNGSAAGDDINVAGVTSLSAVGDVTLDDTFNDFDLAGTGAGEVDVTAPNVTLVDDDDITLGSVSVTGNLTVTAGGAINDNLAEAIIVGGRTSLLAQDGGTFFDIVLDNIDLHDFADSGTLGVRASGQNITIDDLDAVVFENTTARGTFTVASNGDMTQVSGSSINVAGVTSLTAVGAGSDILFAESGNDFDSDAAGTPTDQIDASAETISLRDTDDILLGDIDATGDLTVVAGGTITDNGNGAAIGDDINVAGVTSLSAVGDVTLDDIFNDFDQLGLGTGEVDVTAPNVTLVDDDNIVLGAVSVTGNLTVTAGGAITDNDQETGEAIEVAGATSLLAQDGAVLFDILLDNADVHDFVGSGANGVDATGLNIHIDDRSGIQLGNVSAAGNLTVLAGAGGGNDDLVQIASSTVEVAGATSLAAVGTGSDIVLANTTNNFDSNAGTLNDALDKVDLAGENVTITDTDAIALGSVSVTGSLSILAGGSVTDDAAQAITVAGSTSITAERSGDFFDIRLGAGPGDAVARIHDFNIVTLAGEDIRISDINDMTLQQSGRITNAGGTVDATITPTVAGSLLTSVTGNLTADLIQTDGDAELRSGGTLAVTTVDTTGSLVTNSGGNQTLTGVTTGGNVLVASSGTLQMDTVNATGNVTATSSGAFNFGSVDSGGSIVLTTLNDSFEIQTGDTTPLTAVNGIQLNAPTGSFRNAGTAEELQDGLTFATTNGNIHLNFGTGFSVVDVGGVGPFTLDAANGVAIIEIDSGFFGIGSANFLANADQANFNPFLNQFQVIDTDLLQVTGDLGLISQGTATVHIQNTSATPNVGSGTSVAGDVIVGGNFQAISLFGSFGGVADQNAALQSFKDVNDGGPLSGFGFPSFTASNNNTANGCVILIPSSCQPIGSLTLQLSFDDGLLLGVTFVDPAADEDDPFSNRGDEEEWE